jgi:holo-[acyl-carrier protein] synthase
MPESIAINATAAVLERLELLAHDMLAPAHVGIDAVHIPTWQRHVGLGGEPLLQRTYTSGELAFCVGRPDRLSSRLAGKEAVLKALGTGIRGIGLADVEIVSEPAGRPTVALHGPARARAGELGLDRVEVSLCHEGELALAIAVGLVEAAR